MIRLFAKLRGNRRETDSARPDGAAPGVAPASTSGVAPNDGGFVPQNHLEELLVKASRDPAARPEFTRHILTAQLLFATPNAPGRPGEHTLEAGESLAILNITRDDGKTFPAVFTSPARIAEALGEGTGYVAMLGKTALEIVQANGAWCNPHSAFGVVWAADDLAAMLGKPTSWTVDKDTRVLLGVPKEMPTQLIARIEQIVLPDPRIEEAWLALAQWPERGSFSWYLDIRTSAAREEIAPCFAGVMDGIDASPQELDMRIAASDGGAGSGIRLKPRQTH